MNLDFLTSIFGSGLTIHYAPRILKGAMAEYLRQIEFKEMVQLINENRSLWSAIPANYQQVFHDLGPKLGKMEWFTTEWVIEAGKTSAPSLYSLFIGWPEGHAWLEHQVQDIKNNITGVKNARA